jgi:hypothetical protein
MGKFVCIHGHFYQPPRENPWLETVELQDSAAPYHDWNERIASECYGPNSRARVMDGNGKIVDLVNNYEHISFNFGPTLLSWLHEAFPEIHDRIVNADKVSAEFFSGHGCAMAQGYNHMIMPLANLRDKHTQVLWGIRDFQFRFSRFPEGMWLPETAVDTESLEVLAEAGIKFTILSPFQAKEVRPCGGKQWIDVNGGKIDPRRPYLCRLPSGRSIVLFFYNGGLSSAVAFEHLQADGSMLANRLLDTFSSDSGEDELVHIATDGESYGHHFRYGDMALAWALKQIEQNKAVQLTNYGAYLANHPPKYEAAIHEKSAWSCSHGVGRWFQNCGCSTGGHPEWNQNWRAPLRQAFDWLRDVIAPLFENEASRYLTDPWKARDEYISVILDRSQNSADDFFARCAHRPLKAGERTQVLKLLELQRHAMLMYTSCGWFFDELSGIETVQGIQYAGRVVQLSKDVFDLDLEPPFLERLADAKSNISAQGDGRDIYNRWVKPAMVTWRQATAHYAIGSLFRSTSDHKRKVFVFTFEDDERELVTAGKTRLLIGNAKSTSEITGETAHTSYAVLYMGEHNLTAGVREFVSEEAYREMADDLKQAFDEVDLPKVIRILNHHFGDPSYSLNSLFKDEQCRVLQELLATTRADLENRFRRIAERYVPLMKFLGFAGKSLLSAVETASNFVIRTDLALQFNAESPDIEKLRGLLEEAKSKEDLLMDAELSYSIKLSLQRLIRGVATDPHDLQKIRLLREIAEMVIALPLHLNLWEVQNVYWEMLHRTDIDFKLKSLMGDKEAIDWRQEFLQLGTCLGFAMESLVV